MNQVRAGIDGSHRGIRRMPRRRDRRRRTNDRTRFITRHAVFRQMQPGVREGCDVRAIVYQHARATNRPRRCEQLTTVEIFFTQLHHHARIGSDSRRQCEPAGHHAPIGDQHQPNAMHYSISPAVGDEALA